jgi:hypothetical protein
MNKRNIFSKLSIAIAFVAIASTVTIWEVRRVRAFNPQPDPPGFGMVGITSGQTIRLNMVNLAVAVDGQLPPDPCRVVLTFRDANGRPFTNSDGQVIRRAVELQTGQSAFLDLNADMFAGLSTNADTTGPSRLQLRPFVRVQQAPSGDQAPPDPCRATAEVFDNTTVRTSFVMYAGNHNETLVRDSSLQ